jgi:hypothetical protein
MNLLKTCLAVLAGFLLCYAMLSLQPVKVVHAQGYTHIEKVNLFTGRITSAGTPIGISCVSGGKETECYVLVKGN